jgi:hypothetical protein
MDIKGTKRKLNSRAQFAVYIESSITNSLYILAL